MCIRHFLRTVRNELVKHFRNLFRDATQAYGSIDFNGVGFIKQQDFMASQACQKSGFTQDELIDFLDLSGLFKVSA